MATQSKCSQCNGAGFIEGDGFTEDTETCVQCGGLGLVMAKTPTPQSVICPVPVKGEGEMCHGCVTVIRGQAYSAGDRFFCSTCAKDSDKGWTLFDELRRDFDKFLEELKQDIRSQVRKGE